MRKNFIIIIAIIVIIACGLFFYLKSHKQPEELSALISTSSNTGVQIATSSDIHELIDIWAGGQNLRAISPAIYTNTSTKTTISFQYVPGGNETFLSEVYVNDRDAGQTSGQDVEVIGFSPDGKYFGFRTIQGVGCCSSDMLLNVVNTTSSTGTIISIRPPREEGDYIGTKEIPNQAVSSIIESASWNNDDSLSVIFYCGGYSSDNEYYRISPNEIWRYDLATKKYTLIQTLSESSST